MTNIVDVQDGKILELKAVCTVRLLYGGKY